MRTADEAIRVSGLRNYGRWAHDLFPGHVGPTDVDFLVHREDVNRYLVLEFKWRDEPLGVGQQRVLAGLARLPEFSLAVVRELGHDLYEVSIDGSVRRCSLKQLRAAVKRWWHEGSLWIDEAAA